MRTLDLTGHLTDQGKNMIWVIMRDRLDPDNETEKPISRAKLAKYYHERRVIDVKNFKPVIEF